MSSSRRYPVNFVCQPPQEIPVTCAICLDVPLQPKIVSCCGHSFCAGCIDRVVRDGRPCPLCTGQQFMLTDNMWLERTLNGYDVYCPHKEKGCKWIGQLGQLENHLNLNPLRDRLCRHEPIQCQRCHTHLCERRLMPNHVSKECVYRDIECRYCHVGCAVKQPEQQMKEHMREAVNDHLHLVTKSLAQKGSEIAELKRQLWILTLLLVLAAGGIFHAYAYQALVSESKVNTMEVTMKELVQNFSSIMKLNHDQKLSNFTNLKSTVQSLSSDISHLRKNITQIKASADNATVTLGKIRQSVKKIPVAETKISEIDSKVVSGNEELKKLIQTAKSQLESSIDRTRKDLQALQSSFETTTERTRKEVKDIEKQLENMNSMVTWICNGSNSSSVAKEFQRMKSEVQYINQQADFPTLPLFLNLSQVRERKDSPSPWLSMPFYTHQEGYKMRLVVYPDGKLSGAGTHISVAIYLMSGKYDTKLEWPPNITLEVVLINMLSKDDHTISVRFHTSNYMNDTHITGRVWDDMMAKGGMICPKFASHDSIFKPTDSYLYTEHNSLYFKVEYYEHKENSSWYEYYFDRFT